MLGKKKKNLGKNTTDMTLGIDLVKVTEVQKAVSRTIILLILMSWQTTERFFYFGAH